MHLGTTPNDLNNDKIIKGNNILAILPASAKNLLQSPL